MTTRPTKKLGEVGNIVTGTTPSKANPDFWGGEVPFVKPPYLGTDNLVFETDETLTEEGLKQAKPIPKNSIMVCCIGSLGKIGISGKEVCTNQQINSIIFNEEIVDFKYGYYFCTTLEKIMKRIANQAVVQIINKSQFSEIEIPLPPLSTQKAIVTKLDEAFAEIDEAISLTEESIAKTEEFKKSVLDKVFENLKDKEIVLENIIQQKDLGLVKGSGEQGSNKAYKYLKMNNIGMGGNLVLNSLVNVDVIDEEIKRFKLNYGDFIFNTRNSFELVGKSCVFNITSNEIYLYNNNILRLRFLDSINPFFINYAFLADKQKKQLEKMKSGTTNVSAIYYKNLKDLRIPLPPLEKQSEIVSYLDQVFAETSALKSDYETKLTHLRELKASILQSAFEGKLIAE